MSTNQCPMQRQNFIDDMSPHELTIFQSAIGKSEADLCRVIGLAQTLKLIRDFGGTEAVFNKGTNEKGMNSFLPFAECIGAEDVRRLAEAFNGDRVYIPKSGKAFRAVLNHRMIQEFDALTKTTSASKAVRILARKNGITYRQVDCIVNGKN